MIYLSDYQPGVLVPPHPPGDIWQYLETFVVIVREGAVCHQHLVGRGQRCC